MQYHYEGEDGWKDIEEGEAYRFDVTKWVIFRETPAFTPGYYKQLTRAGVPIVNGFVSWWSHEPDLEIWKQVEVNDVD